MFVNLVPGVFVFVLVVLSCLGVMHGPVICSSFAFHCVVTIAFFTEASTSVQDIAGLNNSSVICRPILSFGDFSDKRTSTGK